MKAMNEQQPGLPVTIGSCRCCGQARTVGACDSQEQADTAATRMCDCAQGYLVRQQMAEAETVDLLLADQAEEVRGYIRQTAAMMREMHLAAATLKLDSRTTVKMKLKEAAVDIVRVNKSEQEGSI